VADALAAMRIGVAGKDRVEPALDTELYENIQISVTRVQEEIEIQEEIAPFETVYVADANLPIDTQQVVETGAEGVTRTRYRVRYEDAQEVNRVLEDTWVAQEPADRVIAYGQQIVPQTITVADGTQITYWRHIRMFASSYSAGTAGVAPTESYYGRTRTGDPMRFGVVAVDPAIIPLRSQVYVSGYGMGDALDTGSAIRARRIDLGYDDDNLVLWNDWVDVYLLWPPPSASQITWVLPNWPRPPE
jgi:3D (Asp-Asp-Asp) domain-containing protein